MDWKYLILFAIPSEESILNACSIPSLQYSLSWCWKMPIVSKFIKYCQLMIIFCFLLQVSTCAWHQLLLSLSLFLDLVRSIGSLSRLSSSLSSACRFSLRLFILKHQSRIWKCGLPFFGHQLYSLHFLKAFTKYSSGILVQEWEKLHWFLLVLSK